MYNPNKITRLVTAALFAAMTCVVTLFLHIPIPNTNGGYIHPGDSLVLMSGIILGPVYGGLSAGIGSMLADLFAGATQYMVATFIIKLLTAAIAAYSYRYIRKQSIIMAGILGAFIVTLGYFICDRILLGNFASASISIPFNLLQNAMGIILASIILPVLIKVPQIRKMIDKK